MEDISVFNIFALTFRLCLPIFIAAFLGGLLAAIVSAMIRVEDQIFSFVLKFTFVGTVLFFGWGFFLEHTKILTQLYWGEKSFF